MNTVARKGGTSAEYLSTEWRPRPFRLGRLSQVGKIASQSTSGFLQVNFYTGSRSRGPVPMHDA